MEVLGGERSGCGAEKEESDGRSVHAGTYAGRPGSATHVYLDLQRTITMRIEIATRDGLAPSYVFRPAGPGNGPWPAVLVFMDGIGIRPAMLEIGERLATYGYFVLLPDLFYRSGPYAPMNAKTVFADPGQRKILLERFMSKATLPALMSDTQAFLEFLASERAVRPGGVATTGYGTGGPASLSAAGTCPDRMVAAASYHGGRLA